RISAGSRAGSRTCTASGTSRCSAAGSTSSRRRRTIPPPRPAPLEYVDERTLRVAGGPGYVVVGEPLRYRFTATGAVASIGGAIGGTLVPLAQLTLPDRISLRDPQLVRGAAAEVPASARTQ